MRVRLVRPIVLAAASLAAGLALPAFVAPHGVARWASGTARAQEPPPMAEDALGTVLVIADPGLRYLRPADGRLPDPSEPLPHDDFQGVTVQNLGARPTRLAALYLDPLARAEGGDACAACRYVTASCSPPVAPGMTWRFPARVLFGGVAPGAPALVSTVYSLNERPAAEYGPAWVAWLDERGLPAEATVADAFCRAILADIPPPSSDASSSAPSQADACPTSLLPAWVEGGELPLDPPLPAGPFRGEPIGGVSHALVPIGLPGRRLPVFDRLEASDLDDLGIGLGDPWERERAWDLPGAWGETPDQLGSHVLVHNPGPDCASATLEAFRTGAGSLGTITTTVPPGAWGMLDVGTATWGLFGSATVRVTSDRPLATALTTDSPGASAASPGTLVRADAPSWLVPLAYQEKVDFAGAAAHGADQEEPDRARGWETNVAIFNPAAERRTLAFRLQAARQPPREFGYPFEPRVQTVLQLGFGLGKPGGFGWGEAAGEAPAMSIGIESLRQASDLPYTIAAWRVRAVPYPYRTGGRPVRAIGLASLGGPALGDLENPDAPPLALVAGGAVTESLAARIAIQNPTTATARVGVDAYAACGLAGSLEVAVDPRQTRYLAVRELPGADLGADAAVVRVLSGEVAALVEVHRPRWATSKDVPPDLEGAYLGAPSFAALTAPAWPTATLGAAPASIELALDVPGGDVATIAVSADGPPRCISFDATTDADWLVLSGAVGPVPGTIGLSVDRARFGAAAERVADVTIAAREPGVLGSPATVRVVARYLEGTPAPVTPTATRPAPGAAAVYIPAAATGP